MKEIIRGSSLVIKRVNPARARRYSVGSVSGYAGDGSSDADPAARVKQAKAGFGADYAIYLTKCQHGLS